MLSEKDHKFIHFVICYVVSSAHTFPHVAIVCYTLSHVDICCHMLPTFSRESSLGGNVALL